MRKSTAYVNLADQAVSLLSSLFRVRVKLLSRFLKLSSHPFNQREKNIFEIL